MPSVFSRLVPMLTPQVVALLVAGLVALRLVQRVWAARVVAQKLATSRAAKAARLQREEALVREHLPETAALRAGSDAAAAADDDSVLGGGEAALVGLGATTLVSRLRAGEVSAKLVLHSLLARLIHAQKRFNVLSEPTFEQALRQVEELDAKQRSGAALGRLHGLPISLKDSVNLAGVDTTLGLCRYAGQPMAADALVVQLLREQGAVFYAKSNIPQTLLSFECSNPLHGRTLSPFNPRLTPGGSSGGESALLACGASVAGIGTDIGGSVRIPAHFSGNTALKPTARRLSLQGFRPSVPGQAAIPAVAGPMAQRVEDLSLLLRELWVPAAWERDCDLVPLPFDEEEASHNKAKLKVGFYVDDGFVPASPACARAVREAAEALRAAGHEVSEFRPPRVADAIALYYSLITSDKCQTLARQLEGEQWEDYCSTLITGVRLPVSLKRAVASLLEKVLKEPKAALIARASHESSVAELWQLQYAQKGLRQDWFDAWKAQGDFDVLLCPVHVLPAVPHNTFKKISFTCSYTLLFNVLDLPAGVLPVTRVDASRDEYTVPPSSILEKAARSAYALKEQDGLPLGVQVVGKPFKDETVLRAMAEIERLVRFEQKPIEL